MDRPTPLPRRASAATHTLRHISQSPCVPCRHPAAAEASPVPPPLAHTFTFSNGGAFWLGNLHLRIDRGHRWQPDAAIILGGHRTINGSWHQDDVPKVAVTNTTMGMAGGQSIAPGSVRLGPLRCCKVRALCCDLHTLPGRHNPRRCRNSRSPAYVGMSSPTRFVYAAWCWEGSSMACPPADVFASRLMS